MKNFEKYKIASTEVDYDRDLLLHIYFEGESKPKYRITLSLGRTSEDQVGFGKGVTILAKLFELLQVKKLSDFVGKELYVVDGTLFKSIDLERTLDTNILWDI